MALSVVVLTQNEEKNIEACLASVNWADETLVIDDFSQDKTVKLAKKAGAKVKQRRLANDFANQRNFGLDQAKNEWVLFLDADERVSPVLAKEIRQVLKKTHQKGFFLIRQDFLWTKKLNWGEAGRTKLLRLAKKNQGRWQRCVHETWQINGPVGCLKNKLNHYPHPNLGCFLQSLNFHSSLHAQVHDQNNKKSTLLRIVFLPLLKFGQNYGWRLGLLDGEVGLIQALLMSFHSFLAWSKLYVGY